MIIKYYSVNEANKILPQLKALVEEIKEKRELLYSEIERHELLEEEDKDNILELMYTKTQINSLDAEIRELIEIIESFGVYVKGLDPFLIDFPSEHNGEAIFLCWKEGEERIEWWHKIHEGFAGRKHISELNKDNPTKFFYK